MSNADEPQLDGGSISPTITRPSVGDNNNPLKLLRVRWFWQDTKNATKYYTFTHAESARLERHFQRLDGATAEAATSKSEETSRIVAEISAQRVLVHEGRYAVDLVRREMRPIYWDSDKPTTVLRGSWFFNTDLNELCPYPEDVATYLENAYQEGLWRKKLSLPSGNHYVVIYSQTEFRQYRHGVEYARHTEGLGPRPRVVKRGYTLLENRTTIEVETEIDDDIKPADHLVLVVHGIGSGHDLSFRSIFDCVDTFRSTVQKTKNTHFTSDTKVEFLPIEWHKNLHETHNIDKTLKPITFDGIPKIRDFANDTILDALFFLMPQHAQRIMDRVVSELNRVYDLYIKTNPTFSGKVSLVGHSLGSIISFDILCHQPGAPQPVVSGEGKLNLRYGTLNFPVDTLFAVGSPIGLFLTMRGTILGESFKLPTCQRIYNICHPYDAVAYRMEPTIDKKFAATPPAVIPHKGKGKRLHREIKDIGEGIKKGMTDMWSSFKTSLTKTFNRSFSDGVGDGASYNVEDSDAADEPPTPIPETRVSVDGTQHEVIGQLNCGDRIDFLLQESAMEYHTTEYLFSISSHLGYWTSVDTCCFILGRLGIKQIGDVSPGGSGVASPRGSVTASPSGQRRVTKVSLSLPNSGEWSTLPEPPQTTDTPTTSTPPPSGVVLPPKVMPTTTASEFERASMDGTRVVTQTDVGARVSESKTDNVIVTTGKGLSAVQSPLVGPSALFGTSPPALTTLDMSSSRGASTSSTVSRQMSTTSQASEKNQPFVVQMFDVEEPENDPK
eukprot:GFYU01003944.1.p1 GENE.GFYU01003944.1~~GFYU01003944.1.p1  ORF type:complete len:782 (-),score=150.72 GFYU01003944.1:18-2363(-)